jgi:alkylation response protein AidB-like acyl-CoA dehydrogenase
MSVLNLLSTEIEDDLRSTVRGLLRDLCDPVAVTALYDGDRTAVDGLWKTLAVDLGLAGLLVPEERGGAGASAREAAVVLEELGRAAAPVAGQTTAVGARPPRRPAHPPPRPGRRGGGAGDDLGEAEPIEQRPTLGKQRRGTG